MSRKPAKPPAKRIVIVDDHPMMREGLVQLINHEVDLEVCAQAGTAAQALAAVRDHQPDLLLADISLPDRSGLELIKDLRTQFADLAVLVVSMHDEALYADRVLRAGGRGYIMKQEGGRKLMQAIRQVLGGRIYVSDKMSAKILEIFSGRKPEPESPIELLSDREMEVLQKLGDGLGTRQIAAELRISVKTVEVHRANIKRKLKLAAGADVVRFAIRWVETRGESPA